MRAHLDFGSIAIMIITVILFILALFVKGFTHDLFLEAGIFLVSAKIIIMAYRNGIASNRIEHKLDEMLAVLAGLKKIPEEESQQEKGHRKRDAVNIQAKSEKAEP
jgi:hypothetical protein